MSGTRGSFERPVALLVSHGQPSAPEDGDAEIVALAEAVSGALGASVQGVTLATEGALEAASAAAPEVPVYPMFMADGWFTRRAMPRRLSAHQGTQMPPFGTDPLLADLAAQAVSDAMDAEEWAAEVSHVVLLGHGSGRSPVPALDTRIFGERILRRLPGLTLSCGFVEQAPFLKDALAAAPERAICLPYFAARRGHMLEDVPEALHQSAFAGPVLDPIGLHPGVPTLIARSLSGFLSKRLAQGEPHV